MERSSEQILTEWLVLNAQSGKAAAIEQLLKIWYPKLLRYATHQLQSPEAAKDVVQEVLLAVARKIGKLKDPVAFPKWVYQILHRRGVDYQRREIRRRKREVTESEPETVAGVAALPSFEDDNSYRVHEALKGLGELSYNVIHLHYLDGLSVNEIAAICRVPAGTVKSRLHTARGKLRELLEEKS